MYCTCAQVIYNLVLYTHTRCITSDGGSERVNKFSDEHGRRHLYHPVVVSRKTTIWGIRGDRLMRGGGGGGGRIYTVYDIIPLLTSAQIGLSLTSPNTSPAAPPPLLTGSTVSVTLQLLLCICIHNIRPSYF